MSKLDDDGPQIDTDIEQDGSVWAVAREAHAAQAREQETREPLELDVPGATGIVIRFKFVALGDTESMAKGVQKLRSITDQALYAAIDTLILACDELLVRLPDGLRPLGDPGQPVRFDHALCAGMGWKPMKARQIVHKLYGGEKGEYSILEDAERVALWMKATGDEVREDFVDG